MFDGEKFQKAVTDSTLDKLSKLEQVLTHYPYPLRKAAQYMNISEQAQKAIADTVERFVVDFVEESRARNVALPAPGELSDENAALLAAIVMFLGYTIDNDHADILFDEISKEA